MEVYLDNSATTQCSKRACDIMVKLLGEEYGNPSSLHLKGVNAENYIKDAKHKIARTLKVNESELVFTSGGTESNNLAIIGTALANQRAGMHIITTGIEHPSVLNAMEYLAEQGFRVTYLPVNEDGIISLAELRTCVTEETILVSIMQVNNEIGVVEPIEQAVKVIKEKNPRALIHVDAIQSYGKMTIYPKRMGIDLLSVSGHKIHGPKGIAFLYIKEKTKIKPLLFGGGQQKNIRSGTENVPGIAGLAEAAAEMYENLETNLSGIRALREMFVQGLLVMEDVTIHGNAETSAPHIVSAGFAGIRSEVLLHALEDRQIYVSAGSACSSNKPAVSRTLKGIGVKPQLLESTIRFSFGVHNTKEEVTYTLAVLNEIVPMLRKYTRH